MAGTGAAQVSPSIFDAPLDRVADGGNGPRPSEGGPCPADSLPRQVSDSGQDARSCRGRPAVAALGGGGKFRSISSGNSGSTELGVRMGVAFLVVRLVAAVTVPGLLVFCGVIILNCA